MSDTAEILFDYFRSVFYDSSNANLNIEDLDEDFVMLGKGLMYFASCLSQYNELAAALGRGDLSAQLPPPENELASPLKSLHASLKHLTWQTQQVAKGDYNQRVDFMGEFADAFNSMTQQLSERREKLENEIILSNNKSMALEQSNLLLSNITRNIPQQIIVVNRETKALLFLNDSAWRAVERDDSYIGKIIAKISSEIPGSDDRRFAELQLDDGDITLHLAIRAYMLEWNHVDADAFVIHDVSEEKKRIETLEIHAYSDSMTNLFNRVYGMYTLNQWLDEKKPFVLVFVDLDNLKYINDNHGHNEGDLYIISAARHISTLAPDNAICCRIGGDEFMLLLPDIGSEDANKIMKTIYDTLRNDDYLVGKEYYYSASYGIAAIPEDDAKSSSEILGLADQRMYEFKRMRKKSMGKF